MQLATSTGGSRVCLKITGYQLPGSAGRYALCAGISIKSLLTLSICKMSTAISCTFLSLRFIANERSPLPDVARLLSLPDDVFIIPRAVARWQIGADDVEKLSRDQDSFDRSAEMAHSLSLFVEIDRLGVIGVSTGF